MKKLIFLLIVVSLVGCATVAVQPRGTVLEKFARSPYVENSAINVGGQWTLVLIQRLPIHWVIVQGSGYRIEIPMTKERWDEVNVGDVIILEGGGGGGA
jgi:hypothetical protein